MFPHHWYEKHSRHDISIARSEQGRERGGGGPEQAFNCSDKEVENVEKEVAVVVVAVVVLEWGIKGGIEVEVEVGSRDMVEKFKFLFPNWL